MGCLLKVYETKILANKLFLKCHFLSYKKNATNSMVEHDNKVKSMA